MSGCFPVALKQHGVYFPQLAVISGTDHREQMPAGEISLSGIRTGIPGIVLPDKGPVDFSFDLVEFVFRFLNAVLFILLLELIEHAADKRDGRGKEKCAGNDQDIPDRDERDEHKDNARQKDQCANDWPDVFSVVWFQSKHQESPPILFIFTLLPNPWI